jgi:hypothetical protein
VISSSMEKAPQRLARPRRVALVALNQAAVGAADARDRLTGREVDDFVDLELVYGAPQRKTGR